MQALKIIALCTLAAIVYGVVHDEITVQISREYFAVGHAPIFGTDTSGFLLALGWGVFATWWAGVLIGVLLAVAARAGPEATVDAAALVRPVVVVLGIMVAVAVVGGLAGYVLAVYGVIRPIPAIAEAVPPGRHARFLAVGATHYASYAAGFVGGLALVFRTGLWRRAAALAAAGVGRLPRRG